MNFSDKVVVITGAGTGIGRELACRLLQQGAYVVVAGRRYEKLEETIANSGVTENALAVSIDVTQYSDLTLLVDKTMERFGRIDVLINNAGTCYAGSITEVLPEEVEYLSKLNLVAPIWLTQMVIPIIEQQSEGMIVNVSSLARLVPVPNQSFYCGTKHGISGFSHALRRELLGTSIRVLTVYPGVVASEIMSESVKEKMEEVDFPFDMMDTNVAIDIIIDGMKREKSMIFPAVFRERLLARINHWIPALVDKGMGKMGNKFHGILATTTQGVRERRKQGLKSVS